MAQPIREYLLRTPTGKLEDVDLEWDLYNFGSEWLTNSASNPQAMIDHITYLKNQLQSRKRGWKYKVLTDESAFILTL